MRSSANRARGPLWFMILRPPVSPHEPSFRVAPWRRLDVLMGVAPLIVLRIGLSLAKPSLFNGVPVFVWYVSTAIVMGWLLLYPLWIGHHYLIRYRRLNARSLSIELLVAVAALPVLLAILAVATQVLTRAVNGPPAAPDVLGPFGGASGGFELIVFLMFTITVAPLAEEVFFRGFLYNSLRGRMNWCFAAIIQAVLFALFHPFELSVLIVIAIGGFAFALLYEWRRTIVTPVILHASLNIVAAVALLSSSGTDSTHPELGVNGAAHVGGVSISGMLPGSAADAAGLKVGDIITAVEGHRVESLRDLVIIVRSKKVGDSIGVQFIRGGSSHRTRALLKMATNRP